MGHYPGEAIGQEQGGTKGDDGGRRPENRGRGHPPHTAHNARGSRSFRLYVGVGALRGNDAIVHQNPQHQDKGKYRQHVYGYRQTEKVDGRKRAHDGKGYAQYDPEGEPEVEEQRQCQNHQHAPLRRIAQHKLDTTAQNPALVYPARDEHALGETGLFPGDIIAQFIGDLQHVLIAHPVDDQGYRPATVERAQYGLVFKAVHDRGHITQLYRGTVLARHQGQCSKLLPGVGLRDRTQGNRAAIGAQGSAGQIPGSTAHSVDHLVKIQAVAAQLGTGHLDGYLVVALAEDAYLTDALQVEYLFAHLVGELLQAQLIQLPVNADAHGVATTDDFFNNGLLGVQGKGRNTVHPNLCLVEGLGDVAARLHFHGDHANAFPCRAANLLDTDDITQLLLYLEDDALLNLLGGAAGIGNRHGKRVGRETREHFLANATDGDIAGDQHDDEQEIGSDRVGGHPTDRAALVVVSGLSHRHAPPACPGT